MDIPPIVSAQEWEAARKRLLVTEKEVMRAHDALAAKRRRMPWVAVDKEYEFEGPDGTLNLRDLFNGRRQLVIYRAFFEPGRAWLARPRVPGLLDDRRPRRPSSRSCRHSCTIILSCFG